MLQGERTVADAILRAMRLFLHVMDTVDVSTHLHAANARLDGRDGTLLVYSHSRLSTLVGRTASSIRWHPRK